MLCPAGDANMLTDASANMSAAFAAPTTAPPAEQLIQPAQTLTLGQTQLQVLDTSGHTPGGVSYYCPEQSVVLTGDALFAGSIGRTDFPQGNHQQLIDSIVQRLWPMGDQTIFIPGHGPESSFGRERKLNPYVSGT